MLYEGESIYNYLQVKEDDDSVILSTNVLFGVQSILKKDNNLTGMYYDYALAAPFMAEVHQKDKMKMLVLGMGTGTYARQCKRYFPNMEIEGVEIDEKITGLAKKYFDFPQDIPVTSYDGRAFLNTSDEKYDVIMVDAYQDITIPFQMSTREFFTMVKEHLATDGVMVVNMNMHGVKEGGISQHLSDTIASVFDTVYTADVAGSTNQELFAASGCDILSAMEQNVAVTEDAALSEMMGRVYGRLSAYQPSGYCMTDDQAPVELLGMRAIDEMIQEEVAYYKDILKNEGIRGLLE